MYLKAPRHILVFGDSNTFGLKPMRHITDFRRLDFDKRWPGIAQSKLGVEYRIIEEGLLGRTTVHPDPVEGAHKNGIAVLPALLESHMPLDLVVVMLGTNDLKGRFAQKPLEVAMCIQQIIQLIAHSFAGPKLRAPEILVVSPPFIIERGFLGDMFEGGEEKSLTLAAHLAEVAKRNDIFFLDAATIVTTDGADGIHLSEGSHAILGRAIANKIKDIFD